MIAANNSSLPIVAVLLASYNGAEYIISQVSSILWQVGVSVEIYIRDDGSLDGTIELVQQAFPGAPIHIVDPRSPYSPGLPMGAARNFFKLIASDNILPSRYDWIALADQDDIWLPFKLSHAITGCIENGAVACSSSVLAFWSDPARSIYIPKHGTCAIDNSLFESPGPGCTFLLHSDAFASLQSYVNSQQELLANIEFHDWFIYAYVCRNVGTWYISPLASMLYRQHHSNVAGAGFSIRQLIKKLSRVQSGWYREQVLLVAGLLRYESLPVIDMLSRMSFWDRICLPFLFWNRRRRLKDKFLLLFVFPF